jgi:hypothetical protein
MGEYVLADLNLCRHYGSMISGRSKKSKEQRDERGFKFRSTISSIRRCGHPFVLSSSSVGRLPQSLNAVGMKRSRWVVNEEAQDIEEIKLKFQKKIGLWAAALHSSHLSSSVFFMTMLSKSRRVNR